MVIGLKLLCSKIDRLSLTNGRDCFEIFKCSFDFTGRYYHFLWLNERKLAQNIMSIGLAKLVTINTIGKIIEKLLSNMASYWRFTYTAILTFCKSGGS